MNKNQNNEVPLEILVARFAYASAAVTTIADVLAMISAGLALRLLEEAAFTETQSNGNSNANRNSSSASNSQNNSMFNFEVEQMQRQMDELIREMKRLKKMMHT